MRLILNVIWLVFAGLWTALGYALAALIMFILIIRSLSAWRRFASGSSLCGRSGRR
jgi:uncharacterized membrane protein YccF (DUF307 family)